MTARPELLMTGGSYIYWTFIINFFNSFFANEVVKYLLAIDISFLENSFLILNSQKYFLTIFYSCTRPREVGYSVIHEAESATPRSLNDKCPDK